MVRFRRLQVPNFISLRHDYPMLQSYAEEDDLGENGRLSDCGILSR